MASSSREPQPGQSCQGGCCASPAETLPPGSQSTNLENIDVTGTEPVKPDGSDTCGAACCAGEEPQPDIQCGGTVENDNCSDGCCGKNESATESECGVSGPIATTANDGCRDACCASDEAQPEIQYGTADDDTCNDGCCGSKESTTNFKSGTSGPAATGANDGCRDACCSNDESPTDTKCGTVSKDSCKDACFFQDRPVSKSSATPDCCAGKPAPCCDDSCMDRLVNRECEKSLACGETHDSASSYKGKGTSYDTHARSTREKYAAKIQALGCLCRALLALGQDSCCPPKPKSSLDRKRCSGKQSAASKKPMKSGNSCCASGTPLPKSSPTVQVRGKAKACSSTHDEKDDCCSKAGVWTAKSAELQSPVGQLAQSRDVEQGLPGLERVILSVSGMTCTGCETSLKRTLAGLEVKNLRTSLVQSKAEFDLDLASVPVASVIKHVEKTTGFRCQQVQASNGANIDVLVPGDPVAFINNHNDWPLGVVDMQPVVANTVQVTFDDTLIGARDLIERGWSSPLQLAPPREDPGVEAGSKHVRNVGLMTILSAVLTIPVIVMAWAPLPERDIAYGSASLALATVVQFVVAGPFYPKALKALVFSRMIEMDLLIVLSTTAAYIFSVVAFGYLVVGKPLSTKEFFETSTLLVTLIMVGRWVAAFARQKAVESISIRSLQTPTAIIVQGTDEKEVDARLLQYGDIFRVLPDCKVPTDGTIISGSSEIDESMITGESRPVEKYVKDAVIAGSINGSGSLLVRLVRLPGENTISTIAKMVEEVSLSKPKLQELADRVATYFVPVVGLIVVITFCAWVGVGINVEAKPGSEAVVQALTYAITVLIVSCPCAIGLAVPMVIVMASGIAASRGVIIKDSETIEIAYKASHVVFDKTGTLTEGQLSIESQVYLEDERKAGEIKSLLLALLSGNKHPVSAAVASKLQSSGVIPASGVDDIKVLTGKGVEAATSSGLMLRGGNSRWLDTSSNSSVDTVLSRGLTAFCFTIDGSLSAVFGLKDTLREDAAFTVTELQKRGISVHVLSGDDDAAVRTITSIIHIPDSQVRSRCTPAEKQAYIEGLQSSSSASSSSSSSTSSTPPRSSAKRHSPTVIFCGDGTNDAVALAQATVGVHMNGSTGTDVAKAAADVVLMRPQLAGILTLINISKKSVRRIWFNFSWSFLYNVFAVLLGGGAFVSLDGARIPPALAGLGELASVLPVIAAGVLMRWEKV